MIFGSDFNAGDRARLARIEEKLDIILQQLGVSFQEKPLEAWQEQARAGHKIDAVKLYRELNGCGLKEAKDAVEQYLAGIGH